MHVNCRALSFVHKSGQSSLSRFALSQLPDHVINEEAVATRDGAKVAIGDGAEDAAGEATKRRAYI